ncbi:dihydrolipoamide acetyltransferase family protein [Micromonospora sp. NPDC049679]|uniref:dihydrolipoamide acetyltransferase family protein n=1 Tax=Micromonospora sp. NPDC049679 TaxID=3155920 RepID=UPI00340ABA23
MSDQVFMLPDLGEGLTEAEIVEWRVAVGDTVEVDQTVVEVETAKAVVDVPCPYAGRIVALHGAPGEARPVGQPLVTVARPDDEPAGHATYREEERAGSGNVLIGYGTGHGHAGRRRRRVPAPAVASRPVAVPAAAAVPAAPPVAAAPRVISPLVRRLAHERGLDLAGLRGSGPGGIVRRADVEEALAPVAAATPASGAGPASAASDDLVIPLRGVRRAIADKLSRSRREIPEVTIWVDVDATALLDTRAAINAARPDRPVSLLALLARICVNGLQRFPALNSRVDPDREEIVQSGRIQLGIAAQTDRGLVVPVISDAQRLTTWELASALAETTAAARAGTLPPARMTGGTFTLNNYGVFGVDGSTPIINHPEAALVGVGRIVDKPWVVNGELAVRKVSQISLTFDHRVCDGGVAGGFLRHVADCIEQPALLIANI